MLLSLLLAAAAPDPAVVALVKQEGGRQCLADRSLCLELPAVEEGAEDAAVLLVTSGSAGATTPVALPAFPDGERPELWPHVVAIGSDGTIPRYLVGILGRQDSMYSGGGGTAARLHLYEFSDAEGAPGFGAEVLDVVWDGSLMIRACFSEQDMKDRLEACHDEYEFQATLGAAPGDGAAFPALAYRAVATSFPRTSRRSQDNSAGKLKRADLVRAEDPACTYGRVLRYNPATSRYEMDRPAPDCSDYTTP